MVPYSEELYPDDEDVEVESSPLLDDEDDDEDEDEEDEDEDDDDEVDDELDVDELLAPTAELL